MNKKFDRKVSLGKVTILFVLFLSVYTGSLYYAFDIISPARGERLDVEIYPQDIKIMFGDTETFGVVIADGVPPYDVSWYANGTLIDHGLEIDYSFPEPCEFIILSVQVRDARNNVGFTSTIVYDPTAQYIVSPFGMAKVASAIIYTNTTHTFAINGSTGVEIDSGTDTSTVLQAAIDAMPLRGGKIVIRQGSYTLTSTLNIPESVLLEGEMVGSVEKDRGVIFNADTGVNEMFKFDGNGADKHRSVGIKNIGIMGNQEVGNIGIFVTHFLWFYIENCHIYYCETNIYGEYNYGLVIENCRLEKANEYEIWYGEDASQEQSTALMVYNCDISPTQGGIGIETDTAYNVFIANNWFEAGPSHTDTGLIHLIDSRGAKITGNKFGGSGGYDILIERVDDSVHSIIIDGNLFKSYNGGTVSVDIATNCPDGVFSNNIIEGIPGTALEVNSAGWVVEGNIFNDIGDTAIYVKQFRTSVVGNTIDDPTNYGIHVTSVGNTVVGNTVYGSEAESNILIEGDHNVVCDNYVEGAYKHGINIASDYNVVQGNYVKNNAQGGNFDGIRLGSGLYNVVTDNYLVDDQGTKTQNYGIRELGTADYNIIQNNHFDGWLTAPAQILGNNTALNVASFPFIQGTTFISASGSAKGWEIDATNEWAIALGQMPAECVMVLRIRVWAVGLAAPGAGNTMWLNVETRAAGSDQVYTTEAVFVNPASTCEINFAVNDVIHWQLTAADDPDVDDISGGDSIEVRVVYRGPENGDIATDAVLRVVEIEYV